MRYGDRERQIQRNRETDLQIRILHRLVSVFGLFKFGFKYDLGLGILIGLDCIGLHLGFGIDSLHRFGINRLLNTIIFDAKITLL